MNRVLASIAVLTLVFSAPVPALAADPLDPAGNTSTGKGSSSSQTLIVAQQAHATFQRGDVFVAVSNGQVQWRLPDGRLCRPCSSARGLRMAGS